MSSSENNDQQDYLCNLMSLPSIYASENSLSASPSLLSDEEENRFSFNQVNDSVINKIKTRSVLKKFNQSKFPQKKKTRTQGGWILGKQTLVRYSCILSRNLTLKL